MVEILQVAAGDGRLTAEELNERLEAALTARTYGELAGLTTDLPAAGSLALPVPPSDVQPKDLIRIETRSGSVKREGRWVVPRRIEAKLASGTLVLDFTEAIVAVPALEIDADVRSGSLTLITKPGIVVDADEVSVRSGHVRVRTPWDSDLPVILRVTISGQVRSGTIRARRPRPPRRTFWEWLRRAPKRKSLRVR